MSIMSHLAYYTTQLSGEVYRVFRVVVKRFPSGQNRPNICVANPR